VTESPSPEFGGADGSARVTVVLTSYNHAEFLGAAIESVLSQTFGDFELVIWDDASTDGSWDIVERYQRQDGRIRGHRNARNLRESYRQALRCLPRRGEYLAIHHSDDVWEPDKLRRQVDCLETRPEIAAVFTGVQVIGERGEPFGDAEHPYASIFDQENRGRHAWLRRFFFRGNCLCHPSVLMRSAALAQAGGYRLGLAQLPDFDLWVRLCLRHEIHILPERLTGFRVRDGEANMSGRRPETLNRLHYEWPKVLSNFLTVKSLDDFAAIFGIRPLSPEHIPATLAMLALDSRHRAPSARRFGLDVLFDQLNSEAGARILRDHFNFGHAEFATLTASDTATVSFLADR
jgi:glycosyltransferase involved in cell wall biosynthesis